jgi:hypothetical protein
VQNDDRLTAICTLILNIKSRQNDLHQNDLRFSTEWAVKIKKVKALKFTEKFLPTF